ncbi:MAG: ADP-ribose-binding protein [Nitrospiraceae bacterium]|nr:MAG: ADP-ribose-binding protein [Nitrospiraceae bacterium]
MIERAYDLWTVRDAPIGITTNGSVTRAGLAVMGRGCALEAARRIPTIRRELGARLRETGNHVYWFPAHEIFTFPVKHRCNERADLVLIRQSARELATLANALGWTRVILPRPGCGNGGLTWDGVRPILADLLDDRFVIVTNMNASASYRTP